MHVFNRSGWKFCVAIFRYGDHRGFDLFIFFAFQNLILINLSKPNTCMWSFVSAISYKGLWRGIKLSFVLWRQWNVTDEMVHGWLQQEEGLNRNIIIIWKFDHKGSLCKSVSSSSRLVCATWGGGSQRVQTNLQLGLILNLDMSIVPTLREIDPMATFREVPICCKRKSTIIV